MKRLKRVRIRKKIEASERAIAHRKSYTIWNYLFYSLGFTNILVGALTASSAFMASISDIATGVLAVVASVISTTILLLRVPEKLASHGEATKKYQSLVVKIEDLHIKTKRPESAQNLWDELEKVADELQELIVKSPTLPNRVLRRIKLLAEQKSKNSEA